MVAVARLLDPILAFLDGLLERWRPRRWPDTPLAVLMVTPALIILTAFGIAPLFYAIYMSLFDYTGPSPLFVGARQYSEALRSHEFWSSFLVTVYYAAGTIPVTMTLSFLIASALFRVGRARGLFRTVYFLPYVTSAVAAATIWRVILNPRFGLVNAVIALLGFESNPFSRWLLEPRSVLYLISGGAIPKTVGPSLALCSIILFEIWHSSGFMIVVFLAGLSALPRELEESARIDGANWFQVTRRITIPLLSPTIFFLAVVSVIKSFQAFNSFYALTGGPGPVNTTQNMTVYIFANFYINDRLGYGAAVAVLLSVAIVCMTIVQWRYLGRKVHYE